MRVRRGNKPRQYEDEPEQDLDITVGSFSSFTEVPKTDKPLRKKNIIGFIRPPKKKIDKLKQK